MRHVRPIFIALIALAALSWQSQPAQATHTVSGGSPLAHIDQISIDLGPAGTNVGVEGNGIRFDRRDTNRSDVVPDRRERIGALGDGGRLDPRIR